MDAKVFYRVHFTCTNCSKEMAVVGVFSNIQGVINFECACPDCEATGEVNFTPGELAIAAFKRLEQEKPEAVSHLLAPISPRTH